MADPNISGSAEKYPRFTGERVFLASSSDVRDVRLAARDRLDRLFVHMAAERPLSIFEWETCTADTPFDQRIAMQENLPRPSDEKCAGLVALLGERIGHAMRDYDASGVAAITEWTQPGRTFRLSLDWPMDKQEQLERVRKGEFPLTGTVFETLDAIGAGKPFHVAYFADRPVTFDDPEVKLNGQSWLFAMSGQFKKTSDFLAWQQADYEIQTRAVANFLNALNERGRGITLHRNPQDALAAIRQFVETRIAPVKVNEGNPYRILDFYDVLDAADLPGRGERSREVVSELVGRASDNRAMVARITGESGCGKTSFMRAGVLAGLKAKSELGRFEVVAVRPTDLHDESGHPDNRMALRFLKQIAREAPDLVPSSAFDRVERARARAPAEAAKVLAEALQARARGPQRLVVGLDQFEEIVDDLNAPDRRPQARNWTQLTEFVREASATGKFGFVYTLESSRQKAFDALKLPDVFREAYEVKLGGVDDKFLTDIIAGPFERAGFKLSSHVVRQLIESYHSYSKDTDSHASVLPLLSVKLFHLFEFVQTLSGRRRTGEVGLPRRWDERGGEITVEDLKGELGFDREIEDMAGDAWRQHASNGPVEDQVADVNSILKPLVALSGDNLDRITLLTIADPKRIGEKLQSFRDRRLVILESGRLRLVHEAVVRQWSLARQWLETKQDYLVQEAELRVRANAWARRKTSDAPDDDDTLDVAMAVLRSYGDEWQFADDDGLAESDRNLRRYCLAVLGNCQAPRRPVMLGFSKSISAVHLAAAYGMVDLLRRMIALDPGCVELKATDGKTPMNFAAWASAAAVEALLAVGADPKSRDNDGWTPLSRAVWQGDDEIFQLLRRYYRTADDFKCPGGGTLLHAAARRGRFEMATELLAVRAVDPKAEDDAGRTPLDHAAMQDQVETYDLFLRYCDVRHVSPFNGDTVLHWAAHFGSSKVADRILDTPEFSDLIDLPNKEGRTALMAAAIRRHDDIVQMLAPVADINAVNPVAGPAEGATALHYAATNETPSGRLGRVHALRAVQALLKEPGIDVNRKTTSKLTPFMLAKGSPHVRRELIMHPGFPRDQLLPGGETPLNHVIAQKETQTVRTLLRMPDVDPEFLSEDGSYAPALMLAHGMGDLVEQLLRERRIDPWKMEQAKSNGFRSAVANTNEQVLQGYLDLLPAEPTAKQRQILTTGITAAVILRKARMIDELVERGADLELVADGTGWTLFHSIALVGDVETFTKLAKLSGKSGVRDSWGRSPADVAPADKRQAIAALLAPEPRGEGAQP